MFKSTTVAVALFFCVLSSSAMAACSWTTLTNGTTADATQVMGNFDCLAPLASPSFTGNVGIGTSSPSSSLEIVRNGIANIRATDATNSTYALLQADNGGGWLYTGSHNLILGTDGGTARLIVQAGTGNVGIATTSPAQALEVNGEVKIDSLASASSTSLCINASVISSCSSSIRYKENVKNALFGLKEILAMRPVTFKWKGRNERDFGLVAEEVSKVNPLFVTYKAGQIEGVKYAQLTAVLVKAIQEQQADIDRLLATSEKQAAETGKMRAELASLKRRMGYRTASR